MGCSAPAATAPAWETVTCAYDGTGTLNTLADVAAYYYKTDLRTFALGNCTGSPVPPATTGNELCSALDDAEPLTPVNKSKLNKVPTTTADPLPTQHMTTFTLGLGASGYMKFSDKYVTDTTGDFPTVKGVSPYQPSDGITANPSSGVCSWQANGLCNWPVPASDEQTTIDDLWHAGVNGHGAYFSATDPDSLSNSISQALAGISAGGGAAAAPTISTPRLAPADNYIFSSKYVSGDWSGELERYQIDPYSGIVTTIPDWAVTAKLDANTSRNIYTFDSSVTSTKLRAFTSANFGTNSYFNKPNISTAPTGLTQFLCASIDTCLSATNQDTTHASGANLVNYLRGDRTNEGALTDNTKYYRQRVHVLGDMVNAQVVYVTSPLHNYGDPGYAAFKTAKANRQAVVYAGANDGMLHAFAAKGAAATEALVEATAAAYAAYVKDGSSTNLTAYNTALSASNAAVAADTVIGQELWAYIPSAVLPNLYHLADKNYKNKHRYYVDATPIVDDVCVADCSDSALADWRTILVGGLGRGGRAFFALDITNPASPKALWEFTDANLGYSYGNSQIAKLSNGTWVVMFASGYNNVPNDDGSGGDGVGRLFVVNALTGAQIAAVSPISTGAGDTTTPSGLSKITAQVVNPSSDNTIEAVYGGDTLGNLWRFDPNGNIGASGYDAQLLAVLLDGSGNTQPITTKPEVGLIQNYKVVFVGTGRFLAAADANDTGQQTLYAIKDPRTSGTTATTAIFSNPGGVRTATSPSNVNAGGFVRQIQSEIDCPVGTLASICAPNTKVVTSTNYPVDFVANNGWYVDLIHSSERANTDPALALGLLAYNTNAPSLLACVAGGKSYSYYLNYLTGGPIYSPGNGDPSLNNGVVGQWLADAYASSPSLVVTEGGDLLKITGLPSEIKTEKPPLPPPANVTRRTSWRELIRE
jgi:type IV pilus assembly protein PilY1